MTVDFVAIGSIIIDDIIDPRGGSNMGMLGGGGSHAVAGMRVWSRKIALVSVIGDAFPETAMHHLKTLADTRGIMSRSVPQPRAWQLFEADGTRNELFRTDFDTFFKSLFVPTNIRLILLRPEVSTYRQLRRVRQKHGLRV